MRLTLQTVDGVTIVGDWNMPVGAAKVMLLLHMMPATRASFAPLAQALNREGAATIAIDLRGHGESTEGNDGRLDYQKFSDAQHQASRLDVDSALNFLKSKGFSEERIALAGASIGANLSLDALQRYPGIRRGVLFSPGLDYRGVKTEPAMRRLGPDQKVWILAAKGDEYSAQSSLALQQLQPKTAKMTLFEGSAHGTNLFTAQASLVSDVVRFFLKE